MGMIDVLKAELDIDPLGRGYSGMDDAAVVVSINDATSGQTLNVDSLNATQLYEAIDTAEFDALSADQKTAVDRILGLGDGINVSSSSKAKAVLMAAFVAESATRAAIVAIVKRDVSRATELGLPRIKVGHVQEARR